MKKILPPAHKLLTLKALTGKFGLLLLAALLCLNSSLYAGVKPAKKKRQVGTAHPVVTYSSPQTYTVDITIKPLVPTSTGVAAVGYSNAVLISGALNPIGGIATDTLGNIYMPETTAGPQKILEILAGTTDSVLFNLGDTIKYMRTISVDIAGNIYFSAIDIADSIFEIFKLPAGGGSLVRIGASHSFANPYDMAVDAFQNVYVTDFTNRDLVKIPADGSTPVELATNVAGIKGVTVDPAGNVYYCQQNNANIRKIPANGSPSIVAFSTSIDPELLTADASGNIFASSGEVLVEFPSGGGNNPVSLPGFFEPSYIAADRTGHVFAIAQFQPANKLQEATPVGGYYISPSLPAGLIFNTATGTISSKPTISSLAKTYTVIAYDTGKTVSANLNIQVLNNYYLAGLKVDSGKLSPVFSPSVTAYTDTVGSDSLHVTPVLNNISETVTVNGTAVTSGLGFGVPLVLGLNTIQVKVTAADGVTSQTYTITVDRIIPSSNAGLSNIVLNNGALSPTFSTSITSYTAVTHFLAVTVTPTALDQFAAIKVNGQSVSSGNASPAIPLIPGANTLTIMVTAENGTIKNYIINVTRLPGSSVDTLKGIFLNTGTLSPVFNPDSTQYTVTESQNTGFITVRPQPGDPDETITVNDSLLASGKPSGTVSPHITLMPGIDTVNIAVTAQDGSIRNYVLFVHKPKSSNTDLYNLVISKGNLSPAFNNDSLNYVDSVSNDITEVLAHAKLQDQNATLRINGVITPSTILSPNYVLNVGSNIFNVAVTAPSGTNKTFTINVLRAPSSNADLDTIIFNGGYKLSPSFNKDTVNYTSSIDLPFISVHAKLSDLTSTLTINQMPAASNQKTDIILNNGIDPIVFQVTAQNGTVKTYTVNVSVAGVTRDDLNPGNDAPADDGLIVHKAITPNGDGINDVLMIDKITAYPNNKFMVISSSGTLVYEVNGYDNKLKAFDGHSSVTDKLQPPGTYFYSLQYTVNGKSKTKTGYVVLKY